MLVLKLKNGTTKMFSFPSVDREQHFRNAWYAMSDTPKYFDKTLKIKTVEGDEIFYKISEIEECRVETPIGVC